MYRISSTNSYHNGRRFKSLAEAKQYADKFGDDCVCDVMALVDRDTYRAVYMGGKSYIPMNRGTYQKGAIG